jgi:glycosyltransferase involved in cell wall biosynthesis
MRIGYVMQEGVDIRRPPFNGPANHVREVVEGLVQRGHQVRTLVRVEGRIWRTDDLKEFVPVTPRWFDRGPLRVVERVTRRVQSELQLPYAAMFESLRFAQACVDELADCDLLYERLSWVAYGAGLAARRLGVPLVLEDNGDALFDLEAKGIGPTGLQRRLSLAMMRRAVWRAAHVVSSGAGWREQFIKRWQYDPRKVTTIENGTALVHALRRDHLHSFNGNGAPGAPVTLVYVGGFYPWHGVPVLLEAVAKARARGSRARLLMIGSGDGFDEARRLADRLGLNGDVEFPGHLKPGQYAPLLAKADIGVSPYCGWPEFSGLKVLDYKAAGLPTIASGVNGHPPTLTSGKTGLIVPPGDVDALSNAIVQLCADASLRKRMGRDARLEAEAMHGWEQTVQRLEQVFGNVLSEGRN